MKRNTEGELDFPTQRTPFEAFNPRIEEGGVDEDSGVSESSGLAWRSRSKSAWIPAEVRIKAEEVFQPFKRLEGLP